MSVGSPLFEINDYVFHGGSGVCVVEDICVPEHLRGGDVSRQYYRLHPLYEAGSVVYTPIDNPRSIMRKITSRQEAEALIQSLPNVEQLQIENDKYREAEYREALKTNNCAEWLRVIKTIYLRNCDRKRPRQPDDRFLRMAEDLLYGELAVPLGIPKEQVREQILAQLGLQEDSCS